MQSAAREFRQTADLYLFAQARKKLLLGADNFLIQDMIGLTTIAGRNGAVVANSFAKLMEAVNATQAPTIWSLAEMAARRAGTKLFSQYFPEIASIRTSAAHPGELSKSKAELFSHKLTSPIKTSALHSGPGIYISDMMETHENSLIFSATVKGRMVSYELSMRTADVLDCVNAQYHRVFLALEPPELARMRKWRQESAEQHQRAEKSHQPWWRNLVHL
ncbi:hypothetical protein F1640_14215 [Novosphingobium sp. NBM11]|uniref:hypothetical protein n=1 Tax=Novosphingobium sp. NBM11 TaxID=2596914 RepID=UPI0018927786|nr:hypothetical protein [Novosphingobium sp. NBM11]MBF5091144.1 hypothetical protein [Novosphingobium sp. NBM11]